MTENRPNVVFTRTSFLKYFLKYMGQFGEKQEEFFVEGVVQKKQCYSGVFMLWVRLFPGVKEGPQKLPNPLSLILSP